MIPITMSSSWEVVALNVKKKYWLYSDKEITAELDCRIRDAGIHVWPTDLSSVPFDLNTPPQEVEWYRIDSYSLTAQILDDIRRANRVMASPADYLRALEKKDQINGKIDLGRNPHICFYKVSGPGQAGTGYESLVAGGGGQPALVSIECGDGWGKDCVFATVTP